MTDADKRNEDQYQDDMKALALRISDVIDGERLTDVACVMAGLCAQALQVRYPDPLERRDAFEAIVGIMARAAEIGYDVEFKFIDTHLQ
jgi:hypothetical protein